MTTNNSIKANVLWVAIDIAKASNDVLVELPNGKKKTFKVMNRMEDYRQFIEYIKSFHVDCIAGFEATADYHRTFAFHLQKAGIQVKLISSFQQQGHEKLYITLGTKMIRKMLKLSCIY